MATYNGGYEAEKVDSNTKHVEVSADSQLAEAADFEDHELGIWKSFTRYPWASAWCVYACFTIILLSFDVQAAGAVVGIPQFRKDFGYEFNGDYVLPAIWQSSFSGAPIATYVQKKKVLLDNCILTQSPSAVISSIASAELADYIGRKKVLALALLISFVAVAIEFIATTNAVFFAGKLLNGFMVGAIGTIMVSYIGEVIHLCLELFWPPTHCNSDHPLGITRYLHLRCWCGVRNWTFGRFHRHQLYWDGRVSLGLPHRILLSIWLCRSCSPFLAFHAGVSFQLVSELEGFEPN